MALRHRTTTFHPFFLSRVFFAIDNRLVVRSTSRRENDTRPKCSLWNYLTRLGSHSKHRQGRWSNWNSKLNFYTTDEPSRSKPLNRIESFFQSRFWSSRDDVSIQINISFILQVEFHPSNLSFRFSFPSIDIQPTAFCINYILRVRYVRHNLLIFLLSNQISRTTRRTRTFLKFLEFSTSV